MMFDVGSLVVGRSSYQAETPSGAVEKRYPRGLVLSWNDAAYEVLVLWRTGPEQGRVVVCPESALFRDPTVWRVTG